jgi:hypothetical protein
MSWWIWTLIGLGVILILFLYRLWIGYRIIQSVEEDYSEVIPKYYYDLDLQALSKAMSESDKTDQLQYNILKLTVGNIGFIEELDQLCQQYDFIAEINQKFSDKVAEIILTPKNLLNAEGNEEA